ncbi:uncharacterized protein LOC130774219 [Actinidia eriantha]|uniref:uncharacterized protein LOC130774219 n=1 Tax=Actinidia eriantha TaxID=165200 RepID=UPI00258CEC2D|nr:uncharacterized protein LOC130774219 [Actinidia eriantha]
MGVTMKVGQNRGRQYGLMLFVSFGAAIFGVMLLHKLREGRIFNLLVQEKDNQLVYLHRLLQKERDYNEEAKRKNEEMKAKIYSLLIQKGELDSRILEMESTISSLKDEQRTVESALEENQTKIKSLREKEIEANKENPQVVALIETLKQKDAEIEDLKRLLKYPVKVWSMSADDPSNSAGNLTQTTSINESIDRDGDVIRGDGMGFTNTRGMIDNSRNAVFRERNTAGDKSSDEVHGKKSTDSQGDGLGVREAKNNANATETIVNHGDDGKARDEYEHEIAGTGNLKSQAGAGDTLRGKQGHAKHPKGKRWRTIARKRRQGSGVNAEMDSASIQSRLRNDAQQSASYKRIIDGELLKLDRQGANRQQDESSEMKNDDKVGLEGEEERKDRSKPQNSIDAENKSDGGGKTDINQHENFEKPNRTTESEDNEIAGDTGKQKSDELGQSEERAGGVQRQTESTNDEKVDENSEAAKIGDKYEEPEDLEVADSQEAETDIRDSRVGVAETQEAEADIRESRARANEVKEESGDETDEPEF